MNQINNRGRARNAAEEIAKKHLAVAEKVPTLLEKIANALTGGPQLAMAGIGV